MRGMPDRKPTLEYQAPTIRKRKPRPPWWIDMPLVFLTAAACLFGFLFLAWFFAAIFGGL
jgi:hypothetical protein